MVRIILDPDQGLDAAKMRIPVCSRPLVSSADQSFNNTVTFKRGSSWTASYRTERNGTERNRTERNRTEQNRTEQNRTEQRVY